MPYPETLKGKRILAVDDEPDVLDVIKEQLVDCEVSIARNYEAARELILTRRFDLIVLDIMGVNGFALLELSRARQIPGAMLTAHALTAENINRALKLGAVSFLPKDELARLPELIAEILDDLARGKNHWERLFKRLGPFFRERLGLSREDLERPQVPPHRH